MALPQAPSLRLDGRRAVLCGTKHGVEGFNRTFAIEWGRAALRGNRGCPTFVRTAPAKETFGGAERVRWIEDKIKPGRVDEVEDIMGPVDLLASDAAALITGGVASGGRQSDDCPCNACGRWGALPPPARGLAPRSISTEKNCSSPSDRARNGSD